jgi:hypothetical protein
VHPRTYGRVVTRQFAEYGTPLASFVWVAKVDRTVPNGTILDRLSVLRPTG